MIRRQPLALPYADAVPALVAAARGNPVRAGCPPPRLVDAALAHGMGGYLAAAVASGKAALPSEEQERLARVEALRAARSELLLRELPGVARTLEEESGSRPLCIKGPVVRRLHPVPSARTFADLDLVLPRRTLTNTARALRPGGWEIRQEFTPTFGTEHGHDVHLERRRAGLRIDVELHWRIGDDPATRVLDHGLLSRRAVKADAGPGLSAPGPQEELLVLATHLLSDREKRLVWVLDVCLAARALEETHWRGAFALARGLGLGWVLHRALDYASCHLGLERPRPLPPGRIPPWGPLRAVEELDMRGSVHLGRLATMDWRGRGRYLRSVVIPSRAGLEAMVGGDGASTWLLVARHVRTMLSAVLPRRH